MQYIVRPGIADAVLLRYTAQVCSAPQRQLFFVFMLKLAFS
jgi:hypothetical protein